MTDLTTVQPDPWLDIADELERIAEAVRSLVGVPAPFVTTLSFQPRPQHPGRSAQVDAIAEALLGKPGAPRQMTSGSYHQDADGFRGPIRVKAYTGIPAPDPNADELARLRAENERLRAAVTGPSPEQLATVAAKLRADQAAGCEAHTPTGPCVLTPGHDELCSPEPLSEGTEGGHGPHALEVAP